MLFKGVTSPQTTSCVSTYNIIEMLTYLSENQIGFRRIEWFPSPLRHPCKCVGGRGKGRKRESEGSAPSSCPPWLGSATPPCPSVLFRPASLSPISSYFSLLSLPTRGNTENGPYWCLGGSGPKILKKEKEQKEGESGLLLLFLLHKQTLSACRCRRNEPAK